MKSLIQYINKYKLDYNIEKYDKYFIKCIHIYDYNFIYELINLINNIHKIIYIRYCEDDRHRRKRKIHININGYEYITFIIKICKYNNQYCYISELIVRTKHDYIYIEPYKIIKDIERLYYFIVSVI